MTKFPYPRVGDFLREELIEPLGLTQTAVAKAAGIPVARLNQILLNRRAITPETDLRLCRVFGYAKGFFLRWQGAQDSADIEDRLGAELDKIERLVGVATSCPGAVA
jgi:addiction module HigA family antidote